MQIPIGRGLIEMKGKTLAGCKVLRRAGEATRVARWLVLSLDAAECGHEFVVEGVKLRQAERDGETVLCDSCAAKRRVARRLKTQALQPRSPTPTPVNDIDLTGQTLAGCKIVCRAPTRIKNARWKVIAACGHEHNVEGNWLRRVEKNGLVIRCPACSDKLRREQPNRRSGNDVAASKRKPQRCRLCEGMSHRVVGERCACCDLPYREETIERRT